MGLGVLVFSPGCIGGPQSLTLWVTEEQIGVYVRSFIRPLSHGGFLSLPSDVQVSPR